MADGAGQLSDGGQPLGAEQALLGFAQLARAFLDQVLEPAAVPGELFLVALALADVAAEGGGAALAGAELAQLDVPAVGTRDLQRLAGGVAVAAQPPAGPGRRPGGVAPILPGSLQVPDGEFLSAPDKTDRF